MPKLKGYSTLCWTCEKSKSGCSWSKDLTPVNGWEAIPTFIHGSAHHKGYMSFKVISCPEYENDGWEKYNIRTLGELLGFGRRKGESLRFHLTQYACYVEKLTSLNYLNKLAHSKGYRIVIDDDNKHIKFWIKKKGG